MPFRSARVVAIAVARWPWLAWLALLLSPCTQASEFLSLRQFGAADGLPQMTVLAIERDRSGYLYVGTQDGLARYDGRRFQRIYLRPGLHDVVGELLADDDGLWVGSAESGLFRLGPDGGIVAARTADGKTLPAIEALALRRDGRGIWVGTPQGLYTCRDRHCQPVPGTQDLPVAALLEGRGPEGDCLWVGTNSVGVVRFDHRPDGRLRRAAKTLDKADGLPNSLVRALAHFGPAGEDGLPPLWIGTGRGVARLVDGKIESHTPENGYPVGGAMAFALLRRADGREQLFTASYGGGLVRFEADGRHAVLSLDNGLPERFLYSLLALDNGEGQAGQLWIGTSAAGLLRVDPGRWYSLDERHILPARSVVSVGELRWPDGRRRVWAGTLSGAVVQDEVGGWRYLLPKDWWTSVVYAAEVDPRGRLWVGMLDGLLRVEDGKARTFGTDMENLPGVSISALLWRGGADGELWIGTGHGLARWRDGRFSRLFADDPRFDNIGIRHMLDLSDRGRGEVALATSEGVVITNGERVQLLAAGCLPHGDTLNLARAGRDQLWAATRKGAVRIDLSGATPSCQVLVLGDGRPRTVYALALDRGGRLYLFGYDGAHRVDNPDDVRTPGARLRIVHFGIEDGLPSLEFNRGALLDAEGRLWAANNAGLVALEPAQAEAIPARAPVLLDAWIGRVRLRPGQSLPAAHGELRFEPRLLSFSAEHRIRYRSQLLGLEDSGSDWSPDGARMFNRLPPGDYRFELQARDAHGREVAAPAISFSIRHPWWQHPASLGAGVLLLVLAGLGIGRWRARSLAKRAADLESEVAHRTEALASANRNLELASNTDPMTGARNRRHFYSAIGPLLDASKDGLWLLLVDIDHFKRINDQHGHAAGDDVLIEIARRLQTLVGDAGLVVRWGGEEFLLACTGKASAGEICRPLLQGVSDDDVDSDGIAIAVSCSIGITRMHPPADGAVEHIDAIVARADAALYRAKNEGRHRAVLAEWREGGLAFETVA